jgi:hypothetical protein
MRFIYCTLHSTKVKMDLFQIPPPQLTVIVALPQYLRRGFRRTVLGIGEAWKGFSRWEYLIINVMKHCQIYCITGSNPPERGWISHPTYLVGKQARFAF